MNQLKMKNEGKNGIRCEGDDGIIPSFYGGKTHGGIEPVKIILFAKITLKYTALAPYISEQLKLHYLKHHQAFVTGANAVPEKMDKARKDNADLDMKAYLTKNPLMVIKSRLFLPFNLSHPDPRKAAGMRI